LYRNGGNPSEHYGHFRRQQHVYRKSGVDLQLKEPVDSPELHAGAKAV
jgi:hypothetical protein